MQKTAAEAYRSAGDDVRPPAKLAKAFAHAFKDEQLRDLEHFWYRAGDERSPFARQLMQLVARLGDKYQVDELAGRYQFTGRTPLTVPQALEVKEELETIDRCSSNWTKRPRRPSSASSTWTSWPSSPSRASVEKLQEFQRQLEEMLRDMAKQQGLERGPEGYQLTPQAYRLFQGQLLERIFSDLEASRTGRHQGPVVGEGAVELPATKTYEFGDSIANMDMTQSLVNALVRGGPGLPIRLKQEDIEIHRTRNTPKCATVVHHGHERLDALRGAIHPREAHGPGARRADSPRVSGRLFAIPADVSRSPSRCRRRTSPR